MERELTPRIGSSGACWMFSNTETAAIVGHASSLPSSSETTADSRRWLAKVATRLSCALLKLAISSRFSVLPVEPRKSFRRCTNSKQGNNSAWLKARWVEMYTSRLMKRWEKRTSTSFRFPGIQDLELDKVDVQKLRERSAIATFRGDKKKIEKVEDWSARSKKVPRAKKFTPQDWCNDEKRGLVRKIWFSMIRNLELDRVDVQKRSERSVIATFRERQKEN